MLTTRVEYNLYVFTSTLAASALLKISSGWKLFSTPNSRPWTIHLFVRSNIYSFAQCPSISPYNFEVSCSPSSETSPLLHAFTLDSGAGVLIAIVLFGIIGAVSTAFKFIIGRNPSSWLFSSWELTSTLYIVVVLHPYRFPAAETDIIFDPSRVIFLSIPFVVTLYPPLKGDVVTGVLYLLPFCILYLYLYYISTTYYFL